MPHHVLNLILRQFRQIIQTFSQILRSLPLNIHGKLSVKYVHCLRLAVRDHDQVIRPIVPVLGKWFCPVSGAEKLPVLPSDRELPGKISCLLINPFLEVDQVFPFF
jgi:hypothetical protein